MSPDTPARLDPAADDWRGVARVLLGSWPSQVASWGREGLAGYITELQARGVSAAETIAAIRSSNTPFPPAAGEIATAHKGRTALDEQREYGEQIRDWLTEHFPDLCDEHWGPHPAAVAEVIRLHYRDGKGALTERRHGREIRQAVRAVPRS